MKRSQILLYVKKIFNIFDASLGAASLIGISSIYKPENVETQPVRPQIPGTQGLLTQDKAKIITQILADRELLDRLMPQLIKRLDGKTLAAKALPYLDISASVSSRQGPTSILNVKDIARDLGLTGAEARGSTAKCNNGEIAISGGFSFQSDPEDSYITTVSPDRQNGWYSGALMGDNGKIQSFVTCLTINVGLKGVQQPQQPSQPSPPPGGPPLQPPTNLR